MRVALLYAFQFRTPSLAALQISLCSFLILVCSWSPDVHLNVHKSVSDYFIEIEWTLLFSFERRDGLSIALSA